MFFLCVRLYICFDKKRKVVLKPSPLVLGDLFAMDCLTKSRLRGNDEETKTTKMCHPGTWLLGELYHLCARSLSPSFDVFFWGGCL